LGLQRFGFGAIAHMRSDHEQQRAKVRGRVGDTMGCYPDEAGFSLSLQRDSNPIDFGPTWMRVRSSTGQSIGPRPAVVRSGCVHQRSSDSLADQSARCAVGITRSDDGTWGTQGQQAWFDSSHLKLFACLHDMSAAEFLSKASGEFTAVYNRRVAPKVRAHS
jgi:hypothetical protein